MRIAIVADTFLPLRTSGAVQLLDLALELIRQGHQPTVLVPSAEISGPWLREDVFGVDVLRLKAPLTKDIGYIRRTLAELIMPYVAWRRLKTSPLAEVQWDGVVWYSPSIFFGPIIKRIKCAGLCRSYLILRDIFPEWAVDMGLMRRGVPYLFFKAIEQYQYSVADVIGVQTPANLGYFEKWASNPSRKVEVLQNWLADSSDIGCSISVSRTPLHGRKIFVYAGNMGVAQGVGVLLNLADYLKSRSDLGFLFVGRGSDVERLRADAEKSDLDNVFFADEIDPDEIPGLYAQCHVGLVALDPRHKTHNVPGKFLSYMQWGLPVLACINPGNDLETLINDEKIGRVSTDGSVATLAAMAVALLDEISVDHNIHSRCKALAERLFSPQTAVMQIVRALQNG